MARLTKSKDLSKKKSQKPLKLNLKEGALHESMGIKADDKLPKTAVNKLASAKPGTKVAVKGKSVPVTKLSKKRAQFAKNAATWKHTGSKKK